MGAWLLLLVAAFCGCQAQNEANLDSSDARVLPIDDTMDVDWKGTQLGESHPHATGATVDPHMPAGNGNTAPVTGTGTAPAENYHMPTGTGGPPTIKDSTAIVDTHMPAGNGNTAPVTGTAPAENNHMPTGTGGPPTIVDSVPASIAMHYPTTTNQNPVTQVAKDAAAVDEMARIAKEAGALSPAELENLSQHKQAVAGTNQPVATHMPPTAPVSTYMPPTTPVATHMPSTEPVATHMPPTAPVSTYMPPTAPVATHMPSTEPVATHIAATKPVVTHIAAIKPVVTHITPEQEQFKKECRAHTLQTECIRDTQCQWSGMFSCVSKAAATALTVASELIGRTAKNLVPVPVVTHTETISPINTHTSATGAVDTHMKTSAELKTEYESQKAKTAITGHASYVKTYKEQHPVTPVTDAMKWIDSESRAITQLTAPVTAGVTPAAVNTHTTTQSTDPVTAGVTPAAMNTHTTAQSTDPVTAGVTSAAMNTHTTTGTTTGNTQIDSLYPATTGAATTGTASNAGTATTNPTTITKRSYTDQYNDEKKSGAANYAVASTYTGGVDYPAGTTATSAGGASSKTQSLEINRYPLLKKKTQSDLIHEAVQSEIKQDKALIVNSAASTNAGPVTNVEQI